MLNKPVVVADDEHGVLIFHIPESKIPVGVQVQLAAAGTPAPKQPDAEFTSEKVDHVRMGIDSFLARCSITTISVLKQQNGYCKVYVNFEVDQTKPGYNSWAASEPYMQLVRGILFDQKHEFVRVNRQGKKVSVVFSGERAKTATNMLVFVSPEKLAEVTNVIPAEKKEAPTPPPEKMKLVLSTRAVMFEAPTSAMAEALAKAGVVK